MSPRLPVRAAAVGVATVALLAALVHARAPARKPSPPMAAMTPATPVRGDLARCQALGAGGAEDATCLRAWAEQRQRFLGVRPRSVEGR